MGTSKRILKRTPSLDAEFILDNINSFSTNGPLLDPLKTSSNRRLSDVFWERRSVTLVENWLKEDQNNLYS